MASESGMAFFSGTRSKLILLLVAALAIYSFAGGKRISERDFVGKWQSSRTNTPLHLAANGEWEIRTAAGAILQYGVWRYEDKKIIWTYKQGERVFDDANPVLSMAPGEFRVREQNGATTVFRRLQ